jgi:transcriptional regulator with XRE-family HTH domain
MYVGTAPVFAPDRRERVAGRMGEEERCRIGERIQAARLAAGWSQQELANRAGLLQRQISQMERGKLNMRFDTLGRVAAALGLKTRDLVTP